MKFQMRTKTAVGQHFESLTEQYLKDLGYEIIGRNLKFKRGELDIVALEPGVRGKALVFIEVRKRDSRSWDTPETSLSFAKQKSLFHSIDCFLMKWRGDAQELRVDLIAFQNEELTHYKDFVQREYRTSKR